MFSHDHKPLDDLTALNEALDELGIAPPLDLADFGNVAPLSVLDKAIEDSKETLYSGIARADVVVLLLNGLHQILENKEIKYRYDEHGNKHFRNEKSEGKKGELFMFGKDAVNAEIESLLKAEEQRIKRDARNQQTGYYLTVGRERPETLRFYIKKAADKDPYTSVTIQLTFIPGELDDIIVYHGYPDDHGRSALSRTKNGQAIPQ
jgi:hypothetical protein